MWIENLNWPIDDTVLILSLGEIWLKWGESYFKTIEIYHNTNDDLC